MVKKLENTTKDTFFIALNTKSLHNKMLNNKGIMTVKGILDNAHTKKDCHQQILILQLDIKQFYFNIIYYLLKKGCEHHDYQLYQSFHGQI